ncbi:YbhB/YbcL family Raf kinase inhibitor-like protein [Rhodobacter sp. SY28-1]|uniref:YbhB/YbcL family Raf kinase inhibitor-like protein n=1 Tax=Rhodobacter sp. SY28-1 TaxID=2562317 RepID=UPI0010BFF1E5|nr:YbhB/YbcL family Raf kinase inhibitor-like protein [Rhodobacter sp. SY28-1]
MSLRLAFALCLAAGPALAEMTLTSPDFADGATLPAAQVFNAMGCTGGNLSPALEWSGAPEGTKSYLLTAYDPDAPTGSGWWHWTVANIPAGVTSLAAGASGAALPDGAVEGRTDFGSPGFGGACPPEGTPPHRYVFTVYAMPEAALPLDGNASGAMFGFYANAMALDRAVLTATYGR